jgi:photosystem II stability/assembly factor-like uncharacterized protein
MVVGMRLIPTLLFLGSLSQLFAADLQWQTLNEPGSGGWLTSLRVHPSNSAHLVLGGDMLGLGVSSDGGKTWGGGFGLKSWEIGDVTFDPKNPSTVWAGTMSGPVVSRDGGKTWETKRKGFPDVSSGGYSAPIQRVMIDPENPSRLLAFGGSYRGWASPGSPKFGFIWESLDGGESWQEFSSVLPYRNITWVDADRAWKRMYAVVQKRGVFVSEDRGKTWKSSMEGLTKDSGIRMVAVHPENPDIAWVAAGNRPEGKDSRRFLPGGIFRTVNGGESWQEIGTGLPKRAGTNPNFTTRFQAIAVSPVDPNQLATSDTSWDHNAVYHSSDGGETWVQVLNGDSQKAIPTAYPAGMGATIITFDPTLPEVFFLANSETVLRTADRGKTWQDITSSVVSQEPVKTFLGHGYSGLCSTKAVFNPFRAGSVILTAMDAGKHIRSDDDWQSWYFFGTGFSNPWGGGNDAAFAKPDGRIAYLAAGQHGGQGSIARTDDAGVTWKEFQGPQHGLPKGAGAEATAVHCDPDAPDRAWAVMGGAFFATKDGGSTWTKVDEIERATVIGKASGLGYPFYVGSKKGVFKTMDGQDFELIPGSPTSPSSIFVPVAAPDHPLVVKHRANDGGVYQWQGSEWKRIFDQTYAFDVAVHPTNPQRIAVSTSDDPYHDISRATGVWLSEDGGVTWHQSNDGLSCTRGKTIAFDPHRPERLVFGSFGRGFFHATWPE